MMDWVGKEIHTQAHPSVWGENMADGALKWRGSKERGEGVGFLFLWAGAYLKKCEQWGAAELSDLIAAQWRGDVWAWTAAGTYA